MQLTIKRGLHAITSWNELPYGDGANCLTVLFTSALGPRYEEPFAASLPDEGKLYVFREKCALRHSQYPIRGITCVVAIDSLRLARGVEVSLYGNRILRGVQEACRDYVHLQRCGERYIASQTELMRFLFRYLMDANLIEWTSDPFFNAVSDYIEQTDGGQLCVSRLVDLCNMNRTAFSRKFVKHFGMPPQQYILSRRMEQARQLLLSGQPIKEVALTMGYNDAKAFSRAFKRVFDVNPGQIGGECMEESGEEV